MNEFLEPILSRTLKYETSSWDKQPVVDESVGLKF